MTVEKKKIIDELAEKISPIINPSPKNADGKRSHLPSLELPPAQPSSQRKGTRTIKILTFSPSVEEREKEKERAKELKRQKESSKNSKGIEDNKNKLVKALKERTELLYSLIRISKDFTFYDMFDDKLRAIAEFISDPTITDNVLIKGKVKKAGELTEQRRIIKAAILDICLEMVIVNGEYAGGKAEFPNLEKEVLPIILNVKKNLLKLELADLFWDIDSTFNSRQLSKLKNKLSKSRLAP